MPSMTTTDFPSNSLLAGDFPRRVAHVTIASGLVLAAGAVLGLDGGEYKPAVAGSVEGEEVDAGIPPSVVLFEDINTTEGAAPGSVLLCGDVRAEALTIDASLTLEAVRWALRPFCLFIN